MPNAERTAQMLLATTGPVRLPVPVEELAELQQCQISRDPVAPHISGFLYRDDAGRRVIGLNARNSLQRQRFTVAHELGHLLLHEGRSFIFDTSARLNWRDDKSSLATDQEEIEANAFAAELLMPKEIVARRWDEISSGDSRNTDFLIREMASELDVSLQAMQYRLVNLGILMPT